MSASPSAFYLWMNQYSLVENYVMSHDYVTVKGVWRWVCGVYDGWGGWVGWGGPCVCLHRKWECVQISGAVCLRNHGCEFYCFCVSVDISGWVGKGVGRVRGVCTGCVCRVFSLNFWWGGDSKFSVPVGPRRGRSQMGGGLAKKNPTEAKTVHLMQN